MNTLVAVLLGLLVVFSVVFFMGLMFVRKMFSMLSGDASSGTYDSNDRVNWICQYTRKSKDYEEY